MFLEVAEKDMLVDWMGGGIGVVCRFASKGSYGWNAVCDEEGVEQGRDRFI